MCIIIFLLKLARKIDKSIFYGVQLIARFQRESCGAAPMLNFVRMNGTIRIMCRKQANTVTTFVHLNACGLEFFVQQNDNLTPK